MLSSRPGSPLLRLVLRALESYYAYEHGDNAVKGAGLTFLYVCSCLLAIMYQVLYMALAVGFSKRRGEQHALAGPPLRRLTAAEAPACCASPSLS